MHRLRLLSVVIVAASVALVSCSEPPQEPRPSLGCEDLPWPGVVPLCRKVSEELTYTRGGHGLVRGTPGWFCTQRTIERVFCSGTAIDVAQIKEALAFGASPKQHEIFFDNRLYACLLGILHELEVSKLPSDQRPAGSANCAPKP